MFTRRGIFQFLGSVAALPLLQACSTTTTTPTIAPTDITKAQTIVSAISGVMTPLLTDLGGIAGVSSSTLSNWQSLASQLVSAASGVLSAATASAGQSAMTTFGNIANSLLGSLSTSTGVLPANAQGIVADIQAVLPIALGLMQVVMAVAAPLRRGAALVNPDQALLDLQRIGAGR